MVQFICDKCHKIFDKKSTYKNHLNRKTPCAPSGTRVDKIEEENKILNKKIIEIQEQMKQLLQKKDEIIITKKDETII